jgi:hypothetical protein
MKARGPASGVMARALYNAPPALTCAREYRLGSSYPHGFQPWSVTARLCGDSMRSFAQAGVAC